MNRLRELREQSGLSVQELAQRSEVDQDLIGQLEAGQSKTTPEVVVKLTKALNSVLSNKNVEASPKDFGDLLETPAADSAVITSTIPVAASNKTAADGEYNEALAAVQSGTVPATNGTASNGVKPGVVSQPPSYLSYETKKEAQQTKLFTTLLTKGVPALIILGLFGWIGWQVWQQFQSDAELSEVVVEEPYIPPAQP